MVLLLWLVLNVFVWSSEGEFHLPDFSGIWKDKSAWRWISRRTRLTWCWVLGTPVVHQLLGCMVWICYTTLQSMMNTKLNKQRFWHCYENRLIKTIQTIPHNLYVSVRLTSLYCGLSWFILILSKGKLTWHSHRGCGVSFESSYWAHFHGSVKTFAYLVWHSL